MIVSPRWVCKHPRPRLTPSVDRLTRSSYNHIRNNRQIMYIILKKHTHTIKTVKSVETRNKNCCFKIKFMCRLFLSWRHYGTAEPRSTWKMVVKTDRDCFFFVQRSTVFKLITVHKLWNFQHALTLYSTLEATLRYLRNCTNWLFYITLHYSIRNHAERDIAITFLSVCLSVRPCLCKYSVETVVCYNIIKLFHHLVSK